MRGLPLLLPGLLACLCAPSSGRAQAGPTFGAAIRHVAGTGRGPLVDAVATGRWNSDITPDLAAAPSLSGDTPTIVFLDTNASLVRSLDGPSFPASFFNGQAGIERLVSIDVGGDGLGDLVCISSAGTIGLSLNAGTDLDQQTGLQPPDIVDELSQTLPQLDILGGDRLLLLPVARSISLHDGDNYPDLLLGGVSTDSNIDTLSTGLIVYQGTATGLSSVPIHVPRQNFVVDAKYIDLDSSVPGPETLAVLEETPPPPGWLGSISYSYSMTFFRWTGDNLVLQGQSDPMGPEHDLAGLIGGRVQSFDAEDLNGDAAMDYVFGANDISWNQPIGQANVVILWGDPRSPEPSRLENGTPQILPPSPTGATLAAIACVRIEDVSAAPGSEIVALEEHVGTATRPDARANLLVHSAGPLRGWTAPPRVHDVGGFFHRHLSASFMASQAATMAAPDAVQLSDLDCDGRPEVIIADVFVRDAAGTLVAGVHVLPNLSAPDAGAAMSTHRATGTPLPLGGETSDPMPRISLTTSEPRIDTAQFGVRLSGTPTGTVSILALGDPIPTVRMPDGFDLHVAPSALSGLFVTHSAPGDPAYTAWAELQCWIPDTAALVDVLTSLQWIYYSPRFDQFGSTQALDITVGS